MEIEGYENYLIYDDGRVYSKYKNIILKPSKDSNGYYQVILYKNKKPKNFNIHRLVGLHYLDKVEGKEHIDHIDRNKINNHISNLRWCNRSENQLNTGIQKNNKLGIKYIKKTKNNTYIFRINREGHYHTKTFKTLEECIEYRNNYLRNSLH